MHRSLLAFWTGLSLVMAQNNAPRVTLGKGAVMQSPPQECDGVVFSVVAKVLGESGNQLFPNGMDISPQIDFSVAYDTGAQVALFGVSLLLGTVTDTDTDAMAVSFDPNPNGNPNMPVGIRYSVSEAHESDSPQADGSMKRLSHGFVAITVGSGFEHSLESSYSINVYFKNQKFTHVLEWKEEHELQLCLWNGIEWYFHNGLYYPAEYECPFCPQHAPLCSCMPRR
jgi:hypothetical protein